ncbi:MAG: cation:proton antiporter [Planctomycetes bacterium]|jgi:Kef-type K+ transport system membrane component KefB|nr:cation:proton antiporter [Planctomycetota bacterium]HPY73816.1 cation:proton antiporter [Planctomycetota bacterium]HPY73824.1 cation:proton antiporter [Planctomycetota bacterium]HQA99474.1 cation:proton antiporter [Planctomycetota bacterium]HQA99482.1 cation:proton antiporter [Planctomycetota bacterium]
MEHARLLLEIGVIVIAIKFVFIFCNKYKISPVFGMVLLGILIGPAVLGIIHRSDTMKFLGDIGVLLLLFLAGLETDTAMMKKTGKIGFFCALAGVFIPFILGIGLGKAYHFSNQTAFYTGCILTATSVSITAMTLWDMGKLQTFIGTSILNSAIIDDIMGIFLLVIVMSFFQTDTSLVVGLGKLFGYLLIASLVGIYIIPYVFKKISNSKTPYLALSLSFATMFIYSGAAEYCEIAPITGAYMAGLFLGFIPDKDEIIKDTEVLAQSLFTPLFFASLGLSANFHGMGDNITYFILFITVACAGKIVGCGLIAKAIGTTWIDSLRMGIGMMPRGEVALAIASLGLSAGMITMLEFNSTVLLVMFSSALTPLLLKLTFPSEKHHTEEQHTEKVTFHPEPVTLNPEKVSFHTEQVPMNTEQVPIIQE